MVYYVRWIYKTGTKETDKEIKKEMRSLDRKHPYPQLWTSLLHLWGRIPQLCIRWQSSLPMTRWGKTPQERSCYQFLTRARQQLQLNPQRNARQPRLLWRLSSQECLILNFVLQALCAPFGKNQSYFILKNVLLCHFIAATLLVQSSYDPWGEIPIGPNRCFTWHQKEVNWRGKTKGGWVTVSPKGIRPATERAHFKDRKICFLKFYSMISTRFLNTI